jgi:hypothetical protein
MRGLFRLNAWSTLVLSLVLLAANVGAPFRTSLGRTFLDGPSQDFAASGRLRVRVITGAGITCGFRAVVGISGGSPDAPDSAAGSRPYPAFSLRLAAAFSPRQPHPPAVRPVCPLRC